MSSAASRAVGKVSQAAGRATQATGRVAAKVNEAGEKPKKSAVNKGARRDPELYILAAIMTGAFGMAGYYFGGKPTSATSEAAVSMAANSMPWQIEGEGSKDFKYQYHPGGDRSKPVKDAPSALNSVIIPSLTLPKKAHDQFNKYGRDDY